MRVEILNPDLKENLMNPTAEQRLQYDKGMRLLDTPPFSPTPYSSLSFGFLVHHLRKTRQSSVEWHFGVSLPLLSTSPHKVNNIMNE